LRVEKIPPKEMHELLRMTNFGHLGCAREGTPYVLPMHYAYDGKDLYFYATEGMKTQLMKGNPQVCLQVEEVTDSLHWRSVMIIGKAVRLDDQKEIAHAWAQLDEHAPAPASATKHDAATQKDDGIALYRIQPEIIDGRQTVCG
jgi:uncharacterized protein